MFKICCHGFLLSDKMFPALGFGAQLAPDWKVCVCVCFLVLLLLLFVCVCVIHVQQYVCMHNKGRRVYMQTCSENMPIQYNTCI